MVARAEAAQATLDRFKDDPFRYGVRDCVRMIAMHLRKLGYRMKLPPSGSYRSYRSALRQLRALGHDSLAAAMDDIGLERIAPAEAIVGDILELPSDNPIGALAIAMGNGRALGYHEDAAGAVVVQPLQITAAWRVEVRWASS